MWWFNQYLELQEWEDCINSKKTKILAIIIFVLCNNTPRYKEYVISFIAFDFGEDVTMIDWMENMNNYV